ncbi:MAG: hypothetical protein J3K34DRAFT_524376 [Monoraphidium minutum]|nr:MAG: hypothetical protein J3K34DRAFT_524376 [Monoraphidium minutum]
MPQACPECRFRGVSFDVQKKMWRARIYVGNKQMNIGRFKSEVEAAQAYDCAALLIRSAAGAAAVGRKAADRVSNFGPEQAARELPKFAGRVGFARLRRKAEEAAAREAAPAITKAPRAAKAPRRRRAAAADKAAPSAAGAAAPSCSGRAAAGGAAAAAAVLEGSATSEAAHEPRLSAAAAAAAAPAAAPHAPAQQAGLTQLPDPFVSQIMMALEEEWEAARAPSAAAAAQGSLLGWPLAPAAAGALPPAGAACTCGLCGAVDSADGLWAWARAAGAAGASAAAGGGGLAAWPNGAGGAPGAGGAASGGGGLLAWPHGAAAAAAAGAGSAWAWPRGAGADAGGGAGVAGSAGDAAWMRSIYAELSAEIPLFCA